MLDLAITWLPIIGAAVFGAGISIWYGNGSKTYAIWIGFIGVIILGLGFSLNLQKIIWDETKVSNPTEAEITARRAYVLVEGSEIRGFASNNPVEGWVSLRNNGVTPASDLQRKAAIFTARYPQADFSALEPGEAKSVLGPGGAVDFGPMRMSRTLTYDERSAVANGTLAIYVYGLIRYRDVFNILRCTNFRLMYRGNGTGISPAPLPLEQLPEGNNFDCPPEGR